MHLRVKGGLIMTNFKPITFAQDTTNENIVVADRYVPHDLYVLNKPIIESLGGTILKGVGGFKAEFTKVSKARKFIAKAITSISEDEYKANRKPNESKPADEGNKKPESVGKGSTDAPKGNKKSTRKGKGNEKPSVATPAPKTEEAPKVEEKGNENELTPAAQKALAKMKMSVLNRAASAYSIANGGVATTFSALGKSEKEINAFIPKAKDALLKSDKWAKASSTHGLTEEMLG
jgi:hypothetical protein